MNPSFFAVARRPQWIGALVLALAIAAAFAALGQWQLARSFESQVAPDQQTERIVDLASVAEPQQPVLAGATGQLVRVDVEFVAGDYVVLSDRVNLDDPGCWVVGHAVTPVSASLAVALGWAANAETCASAIRTLESDPPSSELQGRYLPSESPQEADFEAGQRSVLAVPELINIWPEVDAAYGGYLISSDAPAGLERIDAPAPSTEVSLNLLNVFYAVEWVIFAGFAIFLWYRLVKDAVEEESTSEPPVE